MQPNFTFWVSYWITSVNQALKKWKLNCKIKIEIEIEHLAIMQNGCAFRYGRECKAQATFVCKPSKSNASSSLTPLIRNHESPWKRP